MDEITLIIIGTVHYGDNENYIFEKLNDILTNNKYKNFFWLCEGEKGNRKCISLKDYNIHLLTDALFVNMILIDFNSINESDKDTYNDFIDLLYDRIIEFLITISKVSDKNSIVGTNSVINKCLNLLNNKSDKQILELVDPLLQCLKSIQVGDLIHDLKIMINKIVNSYTSSIVSNKYKKCINDFYRTGHVCEDEIMVLLRDKLFIREILLFIFNVLSLDKVKPKIIITVGRDHVMPLYGFFSNINIKTRYVIFD